MRPLLHLCARPPARSLTSPPAPFHRLPPSLLARIPLSFDSPSTRHANLGGIPTRGRSQDNRIALCAHRVPSAFSDHSHVNPHLRPISPSCSSLYYTSFVHHFFQSMPRPHLIGLPHHSDRSSFMPSSSLPSGTYQPSGT